MNLRSFIRLLRPLVTLPYAVIHTVIAMTFAAGLHDKGVSIAQFWACATALPLLLGIMIAGALQEPMHRSFMLLLPGGMRKLRHAAAFAILVTACFVTAAVAFFAPTVPLFASFGLACALLALPCLDRRRYVAGMGWMIGAAIGWAVSMGLIRLHVYAAMFSAPWAFFFGGLTVAVAALLRGFAAASLRQRVISYFIPTPHSVALAFDRVTTTRQTRELRLRQEQSSKAAPETGRNWSVQRVGPSTWAWMQVTLHTFGSRLTGGSYTKNVLISAGICAAYVLALPLLWLLIGKVGNGTGPVLSYWEMLAATAGSLAGPSSKLTTGIVAMAPLMHPGFAALFAVLIARPRLPYPISRDRIARTVFGLSLLQLATALIVPAIVVAAGGLLGQLVSGAVIADYGLRNIIGMELLLLVALPLIVSGGTFKNNLARAFWAAPIGIALAVAAFFRDDWIPAVLTWPGVATAVIASGGAVCFLWFRWRHYYRTTDQLFESADWGLASV